MKTLGLALIYVAWYLFVFAMCYIFSPWFVLLLIITPRFKLKKVDTNSKDSNDLENEHLPN